MTAVQFLAAGCGTVAFALLFGVPRRFYFFCGLTGGLGWLLYLLLQPRLGGTFATFLAAALVMLLSRFWAVREKCPATIFLISGIIPLVPGGGLYWAVFYFVTNQAAEAQAAGFAAIKAAAAIVLGIVTVFEIPQDFFRLGRGRQEAR